MTDDEDDPVLSLSTFKNKEEDAWIKKASTAPSITKRSLGRGKIKETNVLKAPQSPSSKLSLKPSMTSVSTSPISFTLLEQAQKPPSLKSSSPQEEHQPHDIKGKEEVNETKHARSAYSTTIPISFSIPPRSTSPSHSGSSSLTDDHRGGHFPPSSLSEAKASSSLETMANRSLQGSEPHSSSSKLFSHEVTESIQISMKPSSRSHRSSILDKFPSLASITSSGKKGPEATYPLFDPSKSSDKDGSRRWRRSPSTLSFNPSQSHPTTSRAPSSSSSSDPPRAAKPMSPDMVVEMKQDQGSREVNFKPKERAKEEEGGKEEEGSKEEEGIKEEKGSKEEEVGEEEDDTEWRQREQRGPSGTDLLRQKLSMLRKTLIPAQMEHDSMEHENHQQVSPPRSMEHPAGREDLKTGDMGYKRIESSWGGEREIEPVRGKETVPSSKDQERSSEWMDRGVEDWKEERKEKDQGQGPLLTDDESFLFLSHLDDAMDHQQDASRKEPSFNPMFDPLPPNSEDSTSSWEESRDQDPRDKPLNDPSPRYPKHDDAALSTHHSRQEIMASPGIVSQSRAMGMEKGRGSGREGASNTSKKGEDLRGRDGDGQGPMVATLDVGCASMSPAYSKTRRRREEWDGVPWTEEAEEAQAMGRVFRSTPAQKQKRRMEDRDPEDPLGLEVRGRGKGKGMSLVLSGLRQLDEMELDEVTGDREGDFKERRDQGIFISPAYGRSVRRRQRQVKATPSNQDQSHREKSEGKQGDDEGKEKDDRKMDPFKTPVGRRGGGGGGRTEHEEMDPRTLDQPPLHSEVKQDPPPRQAPLPPQDSSLSQSTQAPTSPKASHSALYPKPTYASKPSGQGAQSSHISSSKQPAHSSSLSQSSREDSQPVSIVPRLTSSVKRSKKPSGATLLSKLPTSFSPNVSSKHGEAHSVAFRTNRLASSLSRTRLPTKTTAKPDLPSQDVHGPQGIKATQSKVPGKKEGKQMGALSGSGKPRTIPPIRSLILASATAKRHEKERQRREQLQRQRERARLQEGERRGYEVEEKRKAEEQRREEDRRRAGERKVALSGVIRKGGGLLVGASVPLPPGARGSITEGSRGPSISTTEKPFTPGVNKQLASGGAEGQELFMEGKRSRRRKEGQPISLRAAKSDKGAGRRGFGMKVGTKSSIKGPREKEKTLHGAQAGRKKEWNKEDHEDRHMLGEDISDQELNMELTGPIRPEEMIDQEGKKGNTRIDDVGEKNQRALGRANEDKERERAEEQAFAVEEGVMDRKEEEVVEEEISILTESDPQEVKSIVMTRTLPDGSLVHELPDVDSE